MSSAKTVLLIDENLESLSFIGRALASHVAEKVLIERSDDTSAGIGAAALGNFDLIVVNRTSDANPSMLVRALRKVNQFVPILVIAPNVSPPLMIDAGATVCLSIAQWDQIGPVVGRLIGAQLQTQNLKALT
jgi:hypothetical protein